MLILALAVIAVERDGHDNSILTVCLLKDCLLIWYNFNRIDILNSNFIHKDQEAFLHIPDNIPEVLPITNRNATVDTKELVATIAYIIGVKKHIVEKCFDAEYHDTLQILDTMCDGLHLYIEKDHTDFSDSEKELWQTTKRYFFEYFEHLWD